MVSLEARYRRVREERALMGAVCHWGLEGHLCDGIYGANWGWSRFLFLDRAGQEEVGRRWRESLWMQA